MDYNVIGIHEWVLFQGFVWDIKVNNDIEELAVNFKQGRRQRTHALNMDIVNIIRPTLQ